MIDEVVRAWRAGDESACPHCGAGHSYTATHEDEGWDGAGHWYAWLLECDACGGRWWATYRLRDAVVSGA